MVFYGAMFALVWKGRLSKEEMFVLLVVGVLGALVAWWNEK